jgi:uncharacterized membrane protein YciS (DUF1049 family)
MEQFGRSGHGLGSALAGTVVAKAPAGMAASVAGTALSMAAVGGNVPAQVLSATTMTKLHVSIIAVVFAGVLATSWIVQNQARMKLRVENEALRQQIGQLRSESDDLSNRVTRLMKSTPLPGERLRELLRLRGEVAALRRQRAGFEPTAALAKAAGLAGGGPGAGTSPSTAAAPFQVQLVVDKLGDDADLMTNTVTGPQGETNYVPLYVQKTPLMDHTAIRAASVSIDPSTGNPQIEVEFSDVGAELFAAVTKDNIDKRLAIVMDGRLYATPIIRSEITGGRATVTGSFTQDEARDLAAKINGALPSH